MKLTSTSITDGAPIDARYAFGKAIAVEDGRVTASDNVSPQLAWTDAPEGTRSFAVLCVDPDVPTDPSLVNREDVPIPVEHLRADFYHWVMIDVPAAVTSLEEGACSEAPTFGGKSEPPGPAGARQGLNDYTSFFAGSDFAGDYHGYDGPWPPWNDERLHHYHFRVLALDVERLPVEAPFDGRAVAAALEGHVLGQAQVVGTYTTNPAVSA